MSRQHRPPSDEGVATGHLLALAFAHHRDGRPAEAEALYRRLLDRDPGHADALHLLGVLHAQTGRAVEAARLIERAIAVSPGTPDFHLNLANALLDGGRAADAVPRYQEALRLGADAATALTGQGRAMIHLDRPDGAERYFRQAAAVAADPVPPLLELGALLVDQDRPAEAVAALEHAVKQAPRRPDTWSALGAAQRRLGQPAHAAHCFAQARALAPRQAAHAANLGISLMELGRLDEAARQFDTAVALAPDDARHHYGRAFCRLLAGDLAGGFAEYAWRTRAPDFTSPRRVFDRPVWDGRPLPGGTILLHAEQGFGDTLQFARYARRVAERVPRVIVEAQPELADLLATLDGVERVVVEGSPPPEVDAVCPIPELPRLFGTTLAGIPAEIPYLTPDPARRAVWRQRLDRIRDRRVGLVWAGRPTHPNDHNRSLTLSALAPLGRVPGVVFVSLQKGPAADQTRLPPPGMALWDAGSELADFADTAAVLATLDLVITVDTAVAHLAGAMGVPTWVLLPVAPDWRWLLGRDDSPWYPSLRLYRQTAWGDWPGVVARVRDDLGRFDRSTRQP
ncbi:tetratricopeptide repeat protein [Azospirillum sp.]|uniref:tetratricopeptide repeat protein n=1 Tax=Azospirillum sp. TaxID=34012 RepID=UPI002D4A96E8|nr:tetratricopeptide repeat protein [Azospirillum sp.]HYD64541.1 tetratricopeptide repeat protein [Azospirillum sp.]